MNEHELRASRLLIVPGGNFVDMGNGLEQATSARVRHAVRRGVNYLGICAGAFIAGHSPYNGFDLTSGVQFPFYSAEARGIRGTARQALLDRLTALDAELVAEARRSLGPATIAELEREAGEELSSFRARMAPDAYQRVMAAAVDRLIRQRLKLPTIAFT